MGKYTDYHRGEAVKNAIALEDHIKKNQCPECVEKHSFAVEQYAEEEAHTNPRANQKKLNVLAELVRKIRRELMNTMKERDEEKLRRIY